MPRWASRLDLAVVSVRPEKVQDITEQDALAEGIQAYDGVCGQNEDGSYRTGFTVLGIGAFPTAREAFRCLWDSINEKRGYSWDSNPWVWAVTFRVVADGDDG
jgi:hypothetical protein